MTSKLGSLYLLCFFVALMALIGCQRVQDVVIDSMAPEDNMVEAIPMKIVLLIDYPESGKDVYLEWVRSVAPTLLSFEEVRRVRFLRQSRPYYESKSTC